MTHQCTSLTQPHIHTLIVCMRGFVCITLLHRQIKASVLTQRGRFTRRHRHMDTQSERDKCISSNTFTQIFVCLQVLKKRRCTHTEIHTDRQMNRQRDTMQLSQLMSLSRWLYMQCDVFSFGRLYSLIWKSLDHSGSNPITSLLSLQIIIAKCLQSTDTLRL